MAKCKGCGATIVWGETPDGKRIPLDPKPPIYRFSQGVAERARMLGFESEDGPGWGFAVSHFATCPNANDFSRSKRK